MDYLVAWSGGCDSILMLAELLENIALCVAPLSVAGLVLFLGTLAIILQILVTLEKREIRRKAREGG